MRGSPITEQLAAVRHDLRACWDAIGKLAARAETFLSSETYDSEVHAQYTNTVRVMADEITQLSLRAALLRLEARAKTKRGSDEEAK